MNFYDKENQRIVVAGEKADAGFWDRHWSENDFKRQVQSGASRIVKEVTKRFLPKNSKVLEGGCGAGQNVYGLSQLGYDCYGVDFAVLTIKKINQYFPELKSSVQDLRKLDFQDSFFDGYWSLGVIEHFSDHKDILSEAKRVLKKGGYLFITFPWLSPQRKWKARKGDYQIYKKEQGGQDFYEYIFNEQDIVKEIEGLGFRLIMQRPLDAVKGIKDETSFGHAFWKKVYQSRSFIVRCFRLAMNQLFSKLTGHSILLVFQKI